MNDQEFARQQSLMERRALLSEILQSNNMMIGLMFVITLLMLYFVDWTNTTKAVWLGTAAPFIPARFDYLIHRAGAYLKRMGSQWENSNERDRMKWILVVADIGALLPILAPYIYVELQAAVMGNAWLVYLTVPIWMVGVASFIIAASQVSKTTKQVPRPRAGESYPV